MQQVTITLLGRQTVDQAFSELTTQSVTLGADPLPVTPAIPPAAAGQELVVRVASAEHLKFVVGSFLDPAALPAAAPILDGEGHQVGVEPAPAPAALGHFIVSGGAHQDAPLPQRGASLVLARLGVALAA